MISPTLVAIPQNGLTSYEEPPSLFVSSFLHCLKRYASLLGFAIYPIPQNGLASYKAYPSFQHHHSAATLYVTKALYGTQGF